MSPRRLLPGLFLVACLAWLAPPAPARADGGDVIARIEAANESGKDEQVRQLVAQAKSQAPNDPTVIFWEGRVAMLDEDFDSAMKLFDKARELEPTNGRYHRWAGHAHIEKLETVNMFSKRGLAKKAIARFQRAVEVAPDDVHAREALAQYYLQAPGIVGGSKDKGLEQIEAMRALDPAAAASTLGWYYNGKKKYDDAAKEFEAGARSAPDNPGAHYNLALYMQTRKKWDEAFAGFERVWTMTEGAQERRTRNFHAAALYQLGRTSAFSGERLDQGIEWVETYLQRDVQNGQPQKTHAYWRLGMIYEHKGDRDQARASYEKALALDPGNDSAKKALKKLK